MAGSPQKRPISYSQTGDESSSPFPMLDSGVESGVCDAYILRTRSLDESNNPTKHGDEHSQEETIATALHTSFDAALDGNSACGSLFDEADSSICDLSGKKHLRQRTGSETLEINPPRTVRKLARRTENDACTKTPGRPRLRPPGSMKKPCSSTPSSAVKRRRAPLPQRQSPMRRVLMSIAPVHPRVAGSTPATSRKDHSIFNTGSSVSASLIQSPQTLTPTRQGGVFGSTLKSMPKWQNTGTTAASSTQLETTFECDSVDTSSPTTRFRFTSFPASLPRVNNPRNRQCPDSVRKRMSFADTCALSDLNQSRDDEGTHNTSISSLSAEGGHQHLPLAPGTHPPAILELNKMNERASGGVEVQGHPQLFDDEDFGYSDDESADPAVKGLVGRTRLNFNMVLSPDRNDEDGGVRAYGEYRFAKASKINLKGLRSHCILEGGRLMPSDVNAELSHPYDQRRINSFPSSLSSNTHMNESGGTLTPARNVEKKTPATPREVQLHFPPEAECSPIPGMRDDDCCQNTSGQSSVLAGNDLLTRTNQPGLNDSFSKTGSKQKEDCSIASDSTNGKSKCLRPMPDMSAFESVAVSSRGDRSDDSATLDSKGMPSSQRLLCPPTPIRTPAWANEGNAHAFLSTRQNSLITTKVLLSCPTQVVEGRCSLESSVLDDDSKASGQTLRKFSATPDGTAKEEAVDRHTGTSESEDSRLARFMMTKSSGPLFSGVEQPTKTPKVKIQAPPRLRRIPSSQKLESVVSFSSDFEILGVLGSGAFADVYKVKSIRDDCLYAVKRNRRQFRGKRDRDMALAEVQSMQRLQKVCAETGTSSPSYTERSSYCLYLLFFYRAWQEDGYFFCQTELCCRDTCRELLDSLRFLWTASKTKYPSLLRNLPASDNVERGSEVDLSGRLVPNMTVWKICHDIAAGLSHIHSHGLVHHDIKPSNIFFVANLRFGAMCKIGDFGMAGSIGSSGDGQEGDARYMPLELLSSGSRRPSSDIFSLGLTLYEIATDQLIEMPSEGPRWHELRSADELKLPKSRGNDLLKLIKIMTHPHEEKRPSADTILQNSRVNSAGRGFDSFLGDYIRDIEEYDRLEDERLALDHHEDQTPRNGSHRLGSFHVRSPSLSMPLPAAPSLLSPLASHLN